MKVILDPSILTHIALILCFWEHQSFLSTLTGETANTTIDSSAPLSPIAKIII